ncbi:MAG: DUF366 family protein [Candidatus Muiribacteriaceae bacterium]
MEFSTFISKEDLFYDGSQLSSNFAYRKFGISGDSIVGFSGGCNIPQENMADLEDILDGEEIYSDKMLHFIAEFFFYDLNTVIALQRIFAGLIAELLYDRTGKRLDRDGDDLYLGPDKLSISIATHTGVSNMFHFAMNLDSRNTPVKTVSLAELGIEDINDLTQEIFKLFSEELKGMIKARCKVRMK